MIVPFLKKLRRRWPSLLAFFLLLITVSSCLFSRIDRTPYRQTTYYAQLQRNIAALPADTIKAAADTLQIGWAKINITPDQRLPLAGYGHRRGAYQSVHDSIWARTVVFDNGIRKAAFITLDLLIVPPELTETLTKKLPAFGYTIDQVYLTAIHSHHSVGAWAPRIAGWGVAGSFRPEWIEQLAKKIILTIQQADEQKETASIGTARYPASELVTNRVVRGGPVDSLVRVFKIRQNSGSTALIVSFSAHATCLHSRGKELSRDYPGALVDSLEKSPAVDFAVFCAGAVGSHGPGALGENFERAGNMAYFLSRKILIDFGRIQLSYQTGLRILTLPLPLRDPKLRIYKDWRRRPWVYYWALGRYPAVLKGLRIGNTLWVGTPCDFSGELTGPIQQVVSDAPLFITSFNGGYIGYITNDAYYDLPHYETRTMNWFGPENGAYLTEAMQELVKRLLKNLT